MDIIVGRFSADGTYSDLLTPGRCRQRVIVRTSASKGFQARERKHLKSCRSPATCPKNNEDVASLPFDFDFRVDCLGGDNDRDDGAPRVRSWRRWHMPCPRGRFNGSTSDATDPARTAGNGNRRKLPRPRLHRPMRRGILGYEQEWKT